MARTSATPGPGARAAPWNAAERAALRALTSPARVQAFLDAIPYSADPFYRPPRAVLRDRVAHCFDGALFAAAALSRLGHAPRILDLRAVRDDDHVLALFQQGGRLGAVAKSNFVGLRFREPIFRGLRELVLSYFEDFYNVAGEKTLRSYSAPLDLSRFDALAWRTEPGGLERIARALDDARHFAVLSPSQVRRLSRVDRRSLEAGLAGANPAGLYRPAKR